MACRRLSRAAAAGCPGQIQEARSLRLRWGLSTRMANKAAAFLPETRTSSPCGFFKRNPPQGFQIQSPMFLHNDFLPKSCQDPFRQKPCVPRQEWKL
jgi:hypothetical protein